MSPDEQYLTAIDRFAEVQRTAEEKTEEFVKAIGSLVVAAAANEAAYEIEAASDFSNPVSLQKTDDAIKNTRKTLTDTVEEAIRVSKLGFHAKHEQNVLRSQLLGDINSD